MAKIKLNKQQEDEQNNALEEKKRTYAPKEQAQETDPVAVNNEWEEESFAVANQKATPEQDEETQKQAEIEAEQQIADEEMLSEAERTEPDALHEKPDERQTFRGRALPLPRKSRDPKMDKDVVPEKMMGLPEDSFLMERKVSPLDLKAHMKHQQRDFVGSNVRKPREFASMFEKGKSTKQAPKLDMSYNIDQNYEFRRELIAQQLLRNLHSRDHVERRNAEKVLREMEVDKELMEEIRKDKKAFKNDEFVEKLQEKVPHL